MIRMDLWEENWNDAYKFFHSKGNVKTKARLKKKWQDNLYKNMNTKLNQMIGERLK